MNHPAFASGGGVALTFALSMLLAALPTGTGPSMLAKLYGREAAAIISALVAVIAR